MPANIVKTFAEKTGKSTKEIEKKWNEAKAIASKSYKETDPKYFPVVTTILKKMLKLEGLVDYNKYIKMIKLKNEE